MGGRCRSTPQCEYARRLSLHSLKRAEEEREALKFTPADEAAVQAAKTKAAAATQAKEAECNKVRGPRCRDKETAEGQALADLGVTTRK